MANAAKILDRMESNPRDWRIEDLKVVAAHFGIEWRQRRSSHVVFAHPESAHVVTVPVARPINPIYVRQFVGLVLDVPQGGVK